MNRGNHVRSQNRYGVAAGRIPAPIATSRCRAVSRAWGLRPLAASNSFEDSTAHTSIAPIGILLREEDVVVDADHNRKRTQLQRSRQLCGPPRGQRLVWPKERPSSVALLSTPGTMTTPSVLFFPSFGR